MKTVGNPQTTALCPCGAPAIDAIPVPVCLFLLLIPYCSEHWPHSEARRDWMIRVALLTVRDGLNEATAIAAAQERAR